MWRNVLCGIVALSCGCNLFSSSPDSLPEDVGTSSDAAFDLTESKDLGDLPDDMSPDGMSAPDAACVPESDVDLCARLVVNCDTINAEDNCGDVRTADCGVCTTPAVCGGGGTPNVCACPDQTDADFCAQEAAVCGAVTAIDECGAERTVSCGTCNADEECMGGGCVCVSETDSAFCMAQAAECGTLTATDRCGISRTANCGGCAAGEQCTNYVCVDEPCSDGVCDSATEDATSCPQDCAATALAAGAQHTCAIRVDGQILCWGGDSDGQLGIGGSAGPAPPTRVNAATDPGVLIAAASTVGGLGTCAAGPTGLYCWGNGAAGQNGVGNTADLDLPQQVTPAEPDMIGVGSDHRCYVDAGNAFCWGDGQYGRLGTGNQTNQNTPTSAAFSDVVMELALGDRHTCAHLASSTVECVGSNLNGQQGNGVSGSGNWNLIAEDVGLTQVEAIAAGHDHSCAVVDAGGTDDVYCWGLNDDGQVGNGGTAIQATPAMVATAGAVDSIAAGTAHTCFVDGNGDVTCWGRNTEGQLGLSGAGDRTSPAAVSLPFGVSMIQAGHRHTCAITDNGQVYCWGANGQGQLGDAAATGGSTPVKVPF